MNRRLFAVVAAIAVAILAGCASRSTPGPASAPETLVSLDEVGRITYIGSITAAANSRVVEIFNAASSKPETILISSNGGNVNRGLDLAEWILDNGLDVEVGDLCFSSCANYVLLAGRVKTLNRQSVLGWHGSVWQESFDGFADPASPDYQPALVELRKRESRFFDRIGVDNVITVYGLGGDPISFLLNRGPTLGFDFDLDDIRRLGVTNVELADGEWNWREYTPEWATRVRRVSLDEEYEFTLSRFVTQP